MTEDNGIQPNLSASIESLPKEWKPDWWIFFNKEVGGQLHPGPRMVSYGKIHTVYRIYDDVNGAFMVAIQPPITPGYVNGTQKEPQWRLRLKRITF